MWTVFYLGVFLAGLTLAVHTMLHGVEQWKLKRSSKPSAVLNPPAVAALAMGIGASGYLFHTRSALGPVLVLLISLCIGAAFLSATIFLMAKWALRHDVSSAQMEEDISGQVATVTRDITPDETGEIAWFAWDTRHVLPAASLDGSEVSAGTEVVIDAVEQGIAQVELWSVVERRL